MKAKKLSKSCRKDLNKRPLRGQTCRNCKKKYFSTSPDCFRSRKGIPKKNICPHWINDKF
jgi:hypothetical protein